LQLRRSADRRRLEASSWNAEARHTGREKQLSYMSDPVLQCAVHPVCTLIERLPLPTHDIYPFMDQGHIKVNAVKLMQILTTDRTLRNVVVFVPSHAFRLCSHAQTQIKTLIQHSCTSYIKINRT
jgi:hypothetical protein